MGAYVVGAAITSLGTMSACWGKPHLDFGNAVGLSMIVGFTWPITVPFFLFFSYHENQELVTNRKHEQILDRFDRVEQLLKTQQQHRENK